MWFFFTITTGTFILDLSPVSYMYISRHTLFGQFIECFHITSWPPCTLVFQNNETAAMLLYQENPVGVEFRVHAVLKSP